MMRNQFILIMKNLHLVKNMFDDKSNELFKIHPFVKCAMKTSSMYTLENHQLVLMRLAVGLEERLNSMFIIPRSHRSSI